MYPNLYYVFKDWFGVDWKVLSFLNTFGLMVAIGFVVSAIVLSAELKRKEKQGLFVPREEFITVGKPASIIELLINFITGFVFAYKIGGLLIDKPDDPQDYIFSTQGNILAGLALGVILVFLKWRDKNKQKLKEPEQRIIRIWPHDRVGDIIVIGLIFGLLGAKLFDNLENWSEFIQDPIGRLFSPSGLTFYGGLILAAVAIGWYAVKKGITLIHLADAVAPALLIAYAVGRIGCQVAGDGDWGIYNSAYITDMDGKVALAKPGEFEQNLQLHKTYFLYDTITNVDGSKEIITDRKSLSLDKVPQASFKAPAFLPKWMAAYNYPNNVNSDGIRLPGSPTGNYNRVLPTPVFPTPLYETILCTLMFLFLWAIRKRIKIPGVIAAIYLVINGIERFAIENIRVNHHYQKFGISLSQAEIIALLLVLFGIILFILLPKKPISTISTN